MKYNYGIKEDSTSNSNKFTNLRNLSYVRVVDIILNSNHPRFKEAGEWEGIGTIYYTSFSSPKETEKSNLKAKPLNSNIKNFPLKNEIVLLVNLPSREFQDLEKNTISYYLSPINIWSSINHNILPNPKNENIKLGEHFEEKPNIRSLLPFEGDIIYEGRFGNSIRFGSFSKNRNPWSEGSGEEGDPILIIRNGQRIDLNSNSWEYILENINLDLNSIYFSSTQQISLEPSSENYKSYHTPPTKIKEYNKPQIILNSDRIVFNSKKDHILFSSKKSIGFSSIESINFDTKESIFDSEVKLGNKNATEGILLGNKTVELLNKILSEIINLSNELSILASLPPGTPFLPLNISATQSKIKLNLYKNQLNTLVSKNSKTI